MTIAICKADDDTKTDPVCSPVDRSILSFVPGDPTDLAVTLPGVHGTSQLTPVSFDPDQEPFCQGRPDLKRYRGSARIARPRHATQGCYSVQDTGFWWGSGIRMLFLDGNTWERRSSPERTSLCGCTEVLITRIFVIGTDIPPTITRKNLPHSVGLLSYTCSRRNGEARQRGPDRTGAGPGLRGIPTKRIAGKDPGTLPDESFRH